MAFIGSQVALNSATPTALYAFNATNSGTTGDPVPVVISCQSDIYVGGPAVTALTGYLLKAGSPLSMQVLGSSEILYAIAGSATPTAYVLLGRQ